MASPTKSILVVEDDETIRETLQFALESRGYLVTTAPDGRVGLEQLAAAPPPNLILLDMMMPVMNGWEFLDNLERNCAFAAIPVVVITAFGEKANDVRAQALLNKPIGLMELFDVVSQYSK